MKKLFQFPILIFRYFLILFGAALLFSCNDFLDGGDFKDQLDKDIARAKETPFTVNIILANPIHGQLNVTSQKLKKDDSFELVFTVANNFIFEEWTCTDMSAIKFEDPKSPTTKVTALKSSNKLSGSLSITPVCSEKFIVNSISPENKDGGVSRDSSILITFSNKVDFSTINNKIKITNSDGASLLSHYKEPELINDGTTIKYAALRENPVITSGTALVTVNIEKGIKNTNGQELEFFSGYIFKLNSTHDSDAPLFVDFRVAKTLDALGLESNQSQNLIGSSTSYEETEDYHIKDSVWIYCMAEDKGSGAYYLTANGKIIPPSYTDTTDDKTKNFVPTAENIYEFGPFKVNLSSEEYADGKINVEFKLYDYCDNECPDTKNYFFIKDTEVSPQNNIVIYNKLRNPDFYLLNQPYYKSAQIYENIYYEYNDFMNSYKTFYIKGIQNDKWGNKNTKITTSNLVLRCGKYTANYVSYDESEEAYIFTFNELETSEEADLILELSIKDSVGNETIYKRSIPNGTDTSSYDVSLYRVVTTNDIYSGSLVPNPKKISPNDEQIDSFSYRLFYEFTWDDATTENFYNNYCKNRWYSMSSYWYMNPENFTFYTLDDQIKELNSWYKRQGEGKEFSTNKKYIRDFWCKSSVYKYKGDTTKQEGSKYYHFYDPYITGMNDSVLAFDYKYSTIDVIDNCLPGYVTLVYIPVYHYSDGDIYGIPVKKYINYSSIESTSSNYTISFNQKTPTPVSCGINTGKCKLELQNVKICDTLGNDVTNQFEVSYFSGDADNYSNFTEPVIYFDSVLTTGNKCSFGVKAIKKDDVSIVISKIVSDVNLPAIDNYPPNVMAKESSTVLYYGEFALYDDDSYDTIKLPIIFDTMAGSGLKYRSYFTDDCLSSQKMFSASSTNYGTTTKVNFEYFWLKREDSWQDNLYPILEEDVIISKAVKSGRSYFTFSLPDAGDYSNYTKAAYEESCDMSSDNLKMIVPVSGLEDGKYLLCIKVSDQNGNYILKPFLYHSIETYTKGIDFYTNSSNKLYVKLGEADSSVRNTWKAVIEKYNTTSNKWEYSNSIMLENPTSYKGFPSITSDYYYRLWLVGCYKKNENYYEASFDNITSYCYSKPVVFYYTTSGATTAGYNMVEGVAGLTILGSGNITQTYYCENEDWGTDYDKWERFGNLLNPKYSTDTVNNYSGYEDVPDGCSYVIASYFKDCSTTGKAKELKIFSKPYQK